MVNEKRIYKSAIAVCYVRARFVKLEAHFARRKPCANSICTEMPCVLTRTKLHSQPNTGSFVTCSVTPSPSLRRHKAVHKGSLMAHPARYLTRRVLQGRDESGFLFCSAENVQELCTSIALRQTSAFACAYARKSNALERTTAKFYEHRDSIFALEAKS